MKLSEIKNQPVDVLAIMLYDMQSFMLENPQLLDENTNNDIDEYRRIVDTEKQYSIDISTLVPGKEYAPLSLTGIPVGKYISVFTTDTDVEYAGRNGTRMMFNDEDGNPQNFPAKDTQLGDKFVDTFVFENSSFRNQFITLLRTAFVGWTVKII